LIQEETQNLNRPITSEEIKLVVKKIPVRKAQDLDSFIGEFHKTFKELLPVLHKLFQKIKLEGTLPNSFYEASINLITKQDIDTTRKLQSIISCEYKYNNANKTLAI